MRLFALFILLVPFAALAERVAPPPPYVEMELQPTKQDLQPRLKAEVARARAAGLRPYVYFWASWCKPCVAIKAGMSDARMQAAFKGTYIIKLDADVWGDLVKPLGYSVGVIPVFYDVGDDGKPTGRKIDGGAWGDDVPANIAPPLDKFFHGR